MAALVLAESVVTLLPMPRGGLTRDEVRLALMKNPCYARLLESWRWSFPLWRAGVIASEQDGGDAVEGVRAAAERMGSERAYAGLSGFLHRELFGPLGDDPELFAADLLKGGPDPGISVPVNAGLDAFALRHRLAVVRAGASRIVATEGGEQSGGQRVARVPSLAQQAELRLSEGVCAWAMPVLVQAGSGTVLEVRAALAGELSALRKAMVAAWESGGAGGTAEAVRAAAGRYGERFEAWASERRGHDDDDGVQVRDGYVRVSLRRLPADAVLRSAAVAVRSLGRGVGAPAGGAIRETGSAERVLALLIDPMSARPEFAPSAGGVSGAESQA